MPTEPGQKGKYLWVLHRGFWGFLTGYVMKAAMARDVTRAHREEMGTTTQSVCHPVAGSTTMAMDRSITALLCVFLAGSQGSVGGDRRQV